VTEPAMIISMPTIARSQQRYDHRLRNLVQRTGDVTVATDLGVPRSTARGWLGETPRVVVCLDVTEVTESELRQEVLKLRRRVRKAHGTAPARAGPAANARVSPHRSASAGRTRQAANPARCGSCPRAPPVASAPAVPACLAESVSCLGPPAARVCARRSVFLSAHIPVSTDALRGRGDQGPGHLARISSRPDRHALRPGPAARQGRASPSTWYRLVRQNGWRRPRLRVHPAKPQVGLRTTRVNEMWHIDTTVIRLLDGTRAYLHAVIDNFSRRILAWRVADTFAPVNSVVVLVEASRGATPSETTPLVLADAGVENVNAQVDELITTGVLRRVLAFTDLKFSNSMIEAWWRSLKHQWLFLPSLARQRHHGASTGRVLRRATQSRASAFGVSGADA
jgi:putative transposase